MRSLRVPVLAIGAASLLAQAPKKDDQPIPKIISTVNVVIAPTTVKDSNGRFVNGLKPNEFRVYDNDKLQEISEDIGFLPLSVVVAVSVNNETEEILPKIKKIGPLFKDLVVGQDGEIAIMSFDSRVTLLQDFTNDLDKINAALNKLRPGSSSIRLNDATSEAVKMLRHKKDRRKVILLISQTRDIASETRIREVVTDLQMNNVDVYTVNISSFLSKITTKPQYPRPDNTPAASRTGPAAASRDPVTVMQMGASGYAMDVFPLFEEVYRGVKGIFWDNPAEAYTKMTGGQEFKFMSQADLERAVASIGENLHSQYLLSYRPNDEIEGGYHRIRVDVMRPNLKVITRPGYWMAARPQ